MKIKCNSFIKYFLFVLSFSVCAKEKIKSFTLENSIPVYVNLDLSSHFTSLSVIVSGGINYYSKEESGLEDAVFNMITSGSKKYSYSDLQDFYYRTGSSISSKPMQYAKAKFSIKTRLLEKRIFFRLLQYVKAPSRIVVMLSGRYISSMPLPSNAAYVISDNDEGRDTVFRFFKKAKVPYPVSVTPFSTTPFVIY